MTTETAARFEYVDCTDATPWTLDDFRASNADAPAPDAEATLCALAVGESADVGCDYDVRRVS